MKNLKAYLAVIFSMAVWSISYVFTQKGLESFRPVTLVTMRMGLATVLLGVYGIAFKQLRPLRRHDLKLFLLMAFLEPFGYFIFEAYGLKYVSPTLASAILAMIPLFAPVAAILIVHERVSWANMLGIVISIGGVGLLIFNNSDISAHPIGLVFLVLAMATALIYSSLLKKAPEEYNALSIIFYDYLFSLMFFIPTFLIADMPHWSEMHWNWQSFYAVLVLAVFASFIAFVFYCYVIRKIGVTRTNAFSNLSPGLTALYMWLVYGEQLTSQKIFGIIIVMIGLFISQIRINSLKVALKKLKH